MNTPHFKKSALAVLSAVTLPTSGQCAAMSAQITDLGDGWYQALPAGNFRARDGRPFDVPGNQWLMDEQAFQYIKIRYAELNQPIVVDYNHATLNKDHTGNDAPAAGWVKLDDMRFDPEHGLLVRPAWTKRAQARIDDKEFCYLSAVFWYDTDTGRPYELRMIAVTNDPGVTGMQAITALSAQHSTQKENPDMNELLKKMLGKLGIDIADGKEPTKEQGESAMTALSALLGNADEVKTLKGQVAALSAQSGGAVDLSKYVPAELYNAALAREAALSAKAGTLSMDKVIDDARTAGKVVAAELDYLKQFGEQQGVAALSAMLEQRPAIAALTKPQPTQEPEDKSGSAALSAADLAVIKATGMSKEDFIKTREGENQ